MGCVMGFIPESIRTGRTHCRISRDSEWHTISLSVKMVLLKWHSRVKPHGTDSNCWRRCWISLRTFKGHRMAYLNPRVAILVRWHPCTNTRPDRYSVQIANFPTKYYCLSSRNVPCEYLQIPHWLAETRIRELGLAWRVTGCGTLPNGDHCLTTE